MSREGDFPGGGPWDIPYCHPNVEFQNLMKQSSTSRYVRNSVTTILMMRYVHCVGGHAGGSPYNHLGSNSTCLPLPGYTHPLCWSVLGRLGSPRTPCHDAGRRAELVSIFCSDPGRRRLGQSSRHQSARCYLLEVCSGSIGYAPPRQPARPTEPLPLHHGLQRAPT